MKILVVFTGGTIGCVRKGEVLSPDNEQKYMLTQMYLDRYGDVDLDGRIDVVDAVLLNKATAGVVELNESARTNADCDADGTVGGNDALALLRFLVHIINSLPEKV